MEELSIGTMKSCFLVKDVSLFGGSDTIFYRWLKAHGFVSWGVKGYYPGVDWVYINIYSKIFAPGMPGYAVTSVVCDHAITIEEFKTIYEIFEKYRGLGVLNMNAEEQKEFEEKWAGYEDKY